MHVGIESFTAMLNDPKLEYEVLKREPPSLEAAASYAVKLEAYAHSLSTRAAVSAERGVGHAQSRPRSVFAVTDEQDGADDKAAALRQRIAQLETAEPPKVIVVLVALLPERLVPTRRPVLMMQLAVVSLFLATGTPPFSPALAHIHTLATFVGN